MSEQCYINILLPFLILILVLFVSVCMMDFSYYVVGKYLRVLLATILIYFICCYLEPSPEELNNVLSWIFFLHLLALVIQIYFPSSSELFAKVFGLQRSSEIFEDYRYRKMGLSSSFDTASLISLVSMIFYFFMYEVYKRKIYIFLMFLSCIALLFSSRAGMVLGGIYLLFFLLRKIYKSNFTSKLAWSLMTVFVSIMISIYIMPLLLSGIGFESQLDNQGYLLIFSEYGGSGSVTQLLGDHLLPLYDLTLGGVIFGFARDPDGTDVGYIKLLYHVGFVGLLMILTIYVTNFFSVFKMKFMGGERGAIVLSSTFIFYIPLLFVMNYKSLEIYSRGAHDLFLIMVFVLLNYKGRRRSVSGIGLSK